MGAAKKVQTETVSKDLMSTALSKSFLETIEESAFVVRRAKTMTSEELAKDKTLSTLPEARAVKYIRTTFKRILTGIVSPKESISSEDACLKICLAQAKSELARSISKSANANAADYYDNEYLTTLTDVATANIMKAFRKEASLPFADRKLVTEDRIVNTYITALKNIHKDFWKGHFAEFRGAGREVMIPSVMYENHDKRISSHEKVSASIYKEEVIAMIGDVKSKLTDKKDRQRLDLITLVMMGNDVKDAAKNVGILVRDADTELVAAAELVKKFDGLLEALEDYSEVLDFECEESLTSASSAEHDKTAELKAEKKEVEAKTFKPPQPLFSYKANGKKYNASVVFWKNGEKMTLNCINQKSMDEAKQALQKMMKDAEVKAEKKAEAKKVSKVKTTKTAQVLKAVG